MKLKRIMIICITLLFLFIVAMLSGWLPFSFVKQYRRDMNKIQQFISNGCIRYFDGCNTCFIDSSQWSCTERACPSIISEPKCLEYQK